MKKKSKSKLRKSRRTSRYGFFRKPRPPPRPPRPTKPFCITDDSNVCYLHHRYNIPEKEAKILIQTYPIILRFAESPENLSLQEAIHRAYTTSYSPPL